MIDLIKKYNVQTPRYTSYPTVPFWNNKIDNQIWLTELEKAIESFGGDGISIYIHLPYCESLCTYCACNTRITKNHLVELPYIKTVIKEWKNYLNFFNKKPLVNEVHLGGGTPTFFSPGNLDYLLDNILCDVTISKTKSFSFEAHPANTTTEHLKVLNKHGFDRVSFGIQDYSLKVQDAIHRFQTKEEVENIVNKARELGFNSINFDLVYGLPFQNLESMADTVNEVIRVKPDRVAFYSYAHVPWVKPGQRKFTEMDLPLGEDKRMLYELGKEIFLKNSYSEIGMDHFALNTDELFIAKGNNRLHRNFMGYTVAPSKILLGLGTSAVSDVYTAYAQNDKTVEGYLADINKAKFSIKKGHVLSTSNIERRKHILNIMCNLQTELSYEEIKTEEFKNILQSLKSFEQDALLVINENKITVTESGKPFLRNIAACFDEFISNKLISQNIFSSTV
ncbi:MAG: oxygen-independent coproporphyrinogen III oxidase [Bacteroidetes bacterium]|nr:oxygen-independent coproporphyrinogen III oxidase [Bacteroidota bacterium]